jgi:hypothetical protein
MSPHFCCFFRCRARRTTFEFPTFGKTHFTTEQKYQAHMTKLLPAFLRAFCSDFAPLREISFSQRRKAKA